MIKKVLLIYHMPNMMSSEEAFAAAVTTIGYKKKGGGVVYDSKVSFTCRVELFGTFSFSLSSYFLMLCI